MPRRSHVLLLAAAAAAALAGCGGAARVGGPSAHTRVITVMNPIDDVQEISGFAQTVERLSKGTLRVRVVISPHLDQTDYDAAAIRDVQAGRADLGWTGSRAWGGSLRALVAPMLIDSYPLQERVLKDDLAKRMLDQLRPKGLVGLAILPGPLRKPVGLTGRLASPADFRGRPIGVQSSAVATAAMRALGADPVPQPVRLDPTALDGVEAPAYSIDGRRLDAPGSHLSGNVNLWPRPLVLFANARSFARLSVDERRIVRSAAQETFPELAALQPTNERDSTGDLCRRARLTFDTASAADLEALRAAFEPVYRDLGRDASTRAAIEAITAMKRDLAAPPDAVPPCRRTASRSARARTPMDGVWTMDTKRSAAGPELLDENYGHWVFVFDRGRFAITQENRTSCTWGYGTVTVAGHHSTWTFTDGGGEAPNDAQNKPGEEFTYGFSTYRDTLTLSPVRGAVSPVNFRAKTWRRVSATPSRAPLSRRCPPPAAALAE